VCVVICILGGDMHFGVFGDMYLKFFRNHLSGSNFLWLYVFFLQFVVVVGVCSVVIRVEVCVVVCILI